MYDLVWTSPPYYNLEKYSKSDADGSHKQTYTEFIEWYAGIFQQAAARLNDNRFLCVKVGEIRNKHGSYYNFVGDNIRVFTEMGLIYYNEIILVNQVGTLCIRAGGAFSKSRKIGKCHQNILVFFKGDPRNISTHVSGL
jgi:DNA modification methylase